MTKPQRSTDFFGIEASPNNYVNSFNQIISKTINPNLSKVLPEISKVYISPSINSLTSNESEAHSKSNSTVSSDETTTTETWLYNKYAKNYVSGLLTVFYFIIVIIYAIVLELSFRFTDTNNKEGLKQIQKNSLSFWLYMYIVSFLFFGYWYILLLLKPRKWRILELIRQKFQRRNLSEENLEDSQVHVINENNASSTMLPNVGSLYLRLGAVIFAIMTCVYYVISAYLRVYLPLDICAVFFIAIQTHFLFCNSTMFDTRHAIISKFGAMHLIAANLQNWFQFLFAKTQSNQKSLGKAYTKYASKYLSEITTTETPSDSGSSEETADTDNDPIIRMVRAAADVITKNFSSGMGTVDCVSNDGVECLLGSFTKVFYTAVVEYSLIAAAIMFIVWHNIERIQNNQLVIHRVHKKSTLRINCSKAVFGLFGGFFFLAGTLISMAFFYGYSGKDQYSSAAHAFGIADISQHAIGIVACILALWRIRLLNYSHHYSHDSHHAAHANQELLDMILLAIGLIGELIFSISGITGLCTPKKDQSYSALLIAAHISRVAQSVLQCILICIASKLKVNSKTHQIQPGKQTITFLIIANMAIFIMNLFESDKVGTSEGVVNFYGEQNWVFWMRSFSPLTVFFRFHSSVCLVEIWKNTYASKQHH